MLPQPVERLVVGAVEEHAPRQSLSLFVSELGTTLFAKLALRHGVVPELLAVSDLLQQTLLALAVVEPHLARPFVDHSAHVLGHHTDSVVGLLNGVAALGWCLLWQNHQARRLHGQCVLRRGPYTDDVVVYHFQLNDLRLPTVRTDGHDVAVLLHMGSTDGQRAQQQGC